MGSWSGTRGPVNVLFGCVRRQSVRVKVFLGAVVAILAVVALIYLVEDSNRFFLIGEAVHAAGIMVLIYKITKKKTCAGLSLKLQELTATFVAVRVFVALFGIKDIHIVIDFATLVSTLWVIYMMRFRLKSSYNKELDTMPRYYVVVPCAMLSLVFRPRLDLFPWSGFFWAFCVYLESVSVLPQLRLMQNAKMVEPFTAHYVFALGVARLLGCASWIIKVIETRGTILSIRGVGFFWYPAMFIAEIVQTFILADFCYYYVKSSMLGRMLPRMTLAV